jgi:tetratricopeptide (TPR) repeat protein
MTFVSAAPPAADRDRDGEQAPPAATAESTLSADRPFPGLRPFAYADRAFFFGRESQSLALYRLVTEGRFVAVVGSSGSGKSSLAMAGLCDLIEQETQDSNGPVWLWKVMRPGGSPIRRLAEATAQIFARDGGDVPTIRDRIESRLRQSSFSLANAIDEAGGLGSRRLLLIVDQFEELFRFGLAGLGHGGLSALEAKAREEATLFVQILLDARRLANLRILITMRSDFIGDCAHFAGLPEAVSATQYLVPGLTRSQLEEVIRRPIEEAGASIEPELVERLLTDCGDELDQLPVLQHCLMRMWDRAGAAAADGPRRLTRQTYADIGRMSDALSQHADEVFRQCAGKELAVEQAFRALSELDREGRAIRRGRRFGKLLDETGVLEADLRAVLDRFRAPTCSFLVPPLSAPLQEGDIVDIGHEALLRRWRTLAGDGLTKTAAPSAQLGWLAEERADGERYRTLVGLVGGEKANLTAPEETKLWWDGRPRTKEWAERYGGRFATVKKLIDDSIAAKKRSRRNRGLTWALAGVTCVVLVAIFASSRQRREEAIDRSAMRSAKTLLQHVLDARNSQRLDVAGAKSIATVSEQFLDEIHGSSRTSGADTPWAQALNVESDLQATSGDYAKALQLANKARDVVLPLTQSNPDDPEPWQVLYDATVRIGDADARETTMRDALSKYNEAVGHAQKIISLKGEKGEDDLIDAHMKVGDVHHIRQNYAEALDEYRAGLSICDAALGKFPGNLDFLRDRGSAFHRIAETQRAQKSFADARTSYRQALAIQQTLVSQDPKDLSLKSNLAATYMHWGALEKEAGDAVAKEARKTFEARDSKLAFKEFNESTEHLDLAVRNFQEGVAIDEELVKKDPGNPVWLDFLAPGYFSIADTIEETGRPKERLMKSALAKEALNYYQRYLDATRDIVFRGGRSPESREKFAAAATLVGDRSSGLDQVVAYRSAVQNWKRMLETSENLTVPSPADQHFGDALRLAKAFDDANDWADAQTAYAVAVQIARRKLAKDPSDTSWRVKAEAADKASGEAGQVAETTPAAAPH